MTRFTFGMCATQGQRSYQEDAAAVWPGAATFPLDELLPPPPDGLLSIALADGMGGHAGGAQASRTVCQTFLRACASAGDEDPQRLVTALHVANDEIAKAVKAKPQLSGMGTTLIGASFGAVGLHWVSVGDSPLYLIRMGEIALLNEDHSLAPALDRLAEEGTISKSEAQNDPRRHMLRSAITGEDLELVDVSRKPLALHPGDLVVLASDGIHTIDTDEIVRIALAYRDDGPESVANALVRSVETQRDPYQDNTTVVVVEATADSESAAAIEA